MHNKMIVLWALGYLITAVLLVRNANTHIGRIEAIVAVTLPVSWPVVWLITGIYHYKEWRHR